MDAQVNGISIAAQGYKKLKHKLMHRQVGFEGQLQTIEGKFSDNVAKLGAAAIYEQHIAKTIKAQRDKAHGTSLPLNGDKKKENDGQKKKRMLEKEQQDRYLHINDFYNIE
jgi:hypothetical protein